jgi:RND family efflux transporter MFP subunit
MVFGRHFVVVAGVSLVVVGGVACGSPDPVEESGLSGAVAVTVEPVRLNLLRQVVTANGQVTPHPDGDWIIHAAETAIVADLPFDEGAPVETDDIVVRFDVPSRTSALQAAEFDLAQWSRRHETARGRVTDLTALFERGLTARIDLDRAKSELATAETTLATVNAAMESLRAAAARDVVRARFPGIVLKRWHYQGDLVTAGGTDPVLHVVDPTRVQVVLDVPVTDAGRVVEGQRVTITAVGAMPLVSTVSSVRLSASANATTTRAIVALPVQPATAPASVGLAIGTPVIGEILIAEVAEAIVVPTRAILRTGGAPYVLLAGPDGRVARRDLRLGISTTDLTQVLEGLAPGEFVITSALNELAEGDLVRFSQ